MTSSTHEDIGAVASHPQIQTASLFRRRHRQLLGREMALNERIKDSAQELADLMQEVCKVTLPTAQSERGANIVLAIRHLEDAVYRALKALTM